MSLKWTVLVICITMIVYVQSTNVQQCPSGAKKLSSDEIQLTNCTKGTCRLRRKTSANITMAFTPEKEITKMTTSVFAYIASIPLPFIGVDGTSACENVYLADGETKTNCPLKAGEKYVYKNEFPILEIYPKLSLTIHWALVSNNVDVACFEVPAKITG